MLHTKTHDKTPPNVKATSTNGRHNHLTCSIQSQVEVWGTFTIQGTRRIRDSCSTALANCDSKWGNRHKSLDRDCDIDLNYQYRITLIRVHREEDAETTAHLILHACRRSTQLRIQAAHHRKMSLVSSRTPDRCTHLIQVNLPQWQRRKRVLDLAYAMWSPGTREYFHRYEAALDLHRV